MRYVKSIPTFYVALLFMGLCVNVHAFMVTSNNEFHDFSSSENGGLNLYAFCNNDPVNHIDYLGLDLYAFDGTGNNENKHCNYTNVYKLQKAYMGKKVHYLPGVGSAYLLNRWWGGFTGWGGKNRLDDMYKELVKRYNSGDPDGKIIDIIGFSRGAALARAFANKIAKEGIPVETYKSNTTDWWIFEFNIPSTKQRKVYPKIRFLGIFDTVASFGIPGNDENWGYDLSIPDNVEHVAHAVARDEIRTLFPLHSIYGLNDTVYMPNRIEKTFIGVHSDIGGGYLIDSASYVPLQWMWEQGNSVADGKMFAPVLCRWGESLVKRLRKKDYSYLIHDSRYIKTPGYRTIYFPH